MSKLESLEMFTKNELSVRQMSNLNGKGEGNPTDGGIMPVHENWSSCGWIYYIGDEGTPDNMTYFSYEEVCWEREP
jgi:hypothetical protein